MKNCKTCKWWIKDDEWGECELVGRNGYGNPRKKNPASYGDWHEPRLAKTYGTGSTSDSGLLTKAEFGCVQHEPKTD